MKLRRLLIFLTLVLFAAGAVSLSINDREAVQELRERSFDDWKDVIYRSFPAEISNPWQDDSVTRFSDNAYKIDDIETIVYDGVNSNLKIVTDESADTLQVTWSEKGNENARDRLKIEKDGKKLKIKEKHGSTDFFSDMLTVLIRVPVAFEGKLDIDLTNGRIEGERLRCEVNIESQNAQISLEMANAKDVTVDSTNSMVDLRYEEEFRKNLRAEIQVINGSIRTADDTKLTVSGDDPYTHSTGDGSVRVRIEIVNGIVTFNR